MIEGVVIVRSVIATVLFGTLLGSAAPIDPKDFLKTYCYDCHNAEKQKGDRRFDTLEFPITDAHGVFEVQDIIDQLNLS